MLVFLACNPTRNRRINREWHTLTGHFNVYFNGEQKLLDATDALEKSHKDDFSRILEVFPYADEAAAKGNSGLFDEAIKKASLSIQNHTVGRYTDDSYLLMGKSHFFKRDYYAALEVFQYINSKYKNDGLRPLSTAWICKCYNGLKKVDEAEAVMGLLLSEVGPKSSKGKEIKPSLLKRIFRVVPKAHYKEIYATAADIAIKQDKYARGVEYMQKALSFSDKKPDKIRYTYIIAQLYEAMDSMALSKQYFTKILGMLVPYDFEFNAILNISKVYDVNDKSSVKKIRRSLKRMLRDEKNDGLYDQIHFELGNLEYRQKNLPEAIKQYQLSVAKSKSNNYQKAMSYLALGNLYLDMPEYKLAQAYYDSTASTVPSTYKYYQKIIDKKNVLSELISNYVIIETEDSLQRLSKLSKNELEKKIDQWIAAKKIADEAKAKAEKERKSNEELLRLNQNAGGNTNINNNMGGSGAQWYFYNAGLIASGRADFFSAKKWGNRTNEDFWRYSAKEKPRKEGDDGTDLKQPKDSAQKVDTNNNGDVAKSKDANEVGDIKKDIAADRAEWVKNIPANQEEFNRSVEKSVEAHFAIGVVYDEKILDYKEAIKAYETLNTRFINNKFEPEALYRLYKDYNRLGQTAKAADVRSRLIETYPESPFALILQNKNIVNTENETNKEVLALYEKIYEAYTSGEYQLVKSMKAEADKKYSGNRIQAKFELLYTLALGKTDSTSIFKRSLEEIVSAYPKTAEAERAKLILDYMKKQETASLPDTLKKEDEPDFIIEDPGQQYYYVFATKAEKADMNEMVAKVTKYNDEFYQFDNLRANTYIANDGYQLLLVRQFKELKQGVDYFKSAETRILVKKFLGFEGTYLNFVISVSNFKKMMKESKSEVYEKIFSAYIQKLNSQKP